MSKRPGTSTAAHCHVSAAYPKCNSRSSNYLSGCWTQHYWISHSLFLFTFLFTFSYYVTLFLFTYISIPYNTLAVIPVTYSIQYIAFIVGAPQES